jgi:hypothetical protein
VTLTPELALIERDLDTALRRLIARRQRRTRTLRTTGALLAAAAAFSVVASAAGLVDLQLDPTTWTIVERGTVDDGKGEYVRATENNTGEPSTFMVEHDAGLDRYEAFLLHERTADAAGNAEDGVLCSAAQLTHAEQLALAALRTGTSASAAVQGAGLTCRGVTYALERADMVHRGLEPTSMLMPGAR